MTRMDSRAGREWPPQPQASSVHWRLRPRPCRWRACGVLGVVSLVGGLGGCTDLGGRPPLPSGIPNQEALKTVAGARQLYQGAVVTFGYSSLGWGALLQSVLTQGMLSDELTVSTGGGSPLDYLNNACSGPNCSLNADYALDSRNLPEGNSDGAAAYGALQQLRARAAEGIGALAQYDTADKVLRGHLYALIGYAELYLADLFCSGVPLSTFDYNQDFTYKPGSPTDQVYADAARQFRQALPLLADSTQWLNLARVGLGRAYLNLGQYDSAAAAVQPVPSDFVYRVLINWMGSTGRPLLTTDFAATVADSEGGVGRPYVSGGDPRTAVVTTGPNVFDLPLYVPAKYGSGTDQTPITVASGLEARLIRAEVALHTGGGATAMLDTLNVIRTDSGMTPIALSAITDSVAVDTLFAERSAWLFLDGHRLGDLRRLLRRYGRTLPQVFPTGLYWVPVPQYQTYGPDVELPIPSTERTVNPSFTGCLIRGL